MRIGFDFWNEKLLDCVKIRDTSPDPSPVSNSSSRRSTVGLFYYRKVGFFGSQSRTDSKRQTKISEMNDPPVFYGVSSFFWTFIVFWILLPALIGDLSKGICIAAAIYMVINDIFYYPSQKDEWDESFFCNKCGAQYIPGGKVLNNVIDNDAKS